MENNTEQGSVFERLHAETTASYQAKMAKSSKHSQRAAPIDKENHSPNPRNVSTAVKDNSETVCKMCKYHQPVDWLISISNLIVVFPFPRDKTKKFSFNQAK